MEVITEAVLNELIKTSNPGCDVRVCFELGKIIVIARHKEIFVRRYRWWWPGDKGRAIRETCDYLASIFPPNC